MKLWKIDRPEDSGMSAAEEIMSDDRGVGSDRDRSAAAAGTAAAAAAGCGAAVVEQRSLCCLFYFCEAALAQGLTMI